MNSPHKTAYWFVCRSLRFINLVKTLALLSRAVTGMWGGFVWQQDEAVRFSWRGFGCATFLWEAVKMKAIVCEMCGSQDLVKQDGMYVCQSCGTKYSPDEAKKLMVEVTGTVKVDNTDRLNNLFQAARQARDSNDAENAAKYYDMIMQEDPNSWEAAFYNVYYRVMQTKIMNIASSARSLKNCLGNVFGLLKKVESLEEQKAAVAEIVTRVTLICKMLESSARSTFKDSWDRVFQKYDDSGKQCVEYASEYHDRSEAVYTTFYTLGDLINKYFGNEPDMQKLAAFAWKTGVQYWVNDYEYFDAWKENKEHIDNTIGNLIRKYEPDYVIPAPQYDGFPSAFVSVIRKDGQGAPVKKGGCYVATAVYGSYDCPQVWTLRRFRDYTLSETWYGRAFIRTYYAISPTLVKMFGKTEWFRNLWKPTLDRIVDRLNNEGVECTPYSDKNW